MATVFKTERLSERYAEEMYIIGEVLELVLNESRWPNIGCLVVSLRDNGNLEHLLKINIIGVDDAVRADALEDNLAIYAELCTEAIETLDTAIVQYRRPIKDGLQRLSEGTLRSLYCRINGGARLYLAYFGTYAEDTGIEIGRVYLALAKIIGHLFPEDEHLLKTVAHVIDELLDQGDGKADYNDTTALVESELKHLC